jgi:hypothetical protein
MIYPLTRRSIFVGAAASIICAPAIVRAATLMPVRSLPLQFLNPLGDSTDVAFITRSRAT